MLETFPISKQSRLDTRIVRELHDSLSFINEKQDLIFIGPTGCGKTGLATSFLVHATNHGCRGLFFDLIRRRHRNNPTIITTQLDFGEWGTFLHDVHLTAAMLDRITVNCAVFNMKNCISIRPKKVVYAVKKK